MEWLCTALVSTRNCFGWVNFENCLEIQHPTITEEWTKLRKRKCPRNGKFQLCYFMKTIFVNGGRHTPYTEVVSISLGFLSEVLWHSISLMTWNHSFDYRPVQAKVDFWFWIYIKVSLKSIQWNYLQAFDHWNTRIASLYFWLWGHKNRKSCDLNFAFFNFYSYGHKEFRVMFFRAIILRIGLI